MDRVRETLHNKPEVIHVCGKTAKLQNSFRVVKEINHFLVIMYTVLVVPENFFPSRCYLFELTFQIRSQEELDGTFFLDYYCVV